MNTRNFNTTHTTSSGFVGGFLLGSALVGLGYYLAKNPQLTEQLTTKLRDGFSSGTEGSGNVQEKFSSYMHDTKSSLNESISKTKSQLNDTFERLTTAFTAGREAARESLKKSVNTTDFSHGLDMSPGSNVGIFTSTAGTNMGAVEDTSVDNTSSSLHPTTNNVAQNVGDAGTMFEERTASSYKNPGNPGWE